jgi:hypothetical protein
MRFNWGAWLYDFAAMYQHMRFRRTSASLGALGETMKALGAGMEATTQAVQGFSDWCDALPEVEKKEMRRLDASP